MPAAERQRETGTIWRLLPAAVADNWPDTAYAEPERVLTWVG